MSSYPRVSVEPGVPPGVPLMYSRTLYEALYEAAHEKRHLMAFSGKYEIFKFSCSPGFRKYAIENRFEKS